MVGGERADEHVVGGFLDDLCCLVSRYLALSCGTRAGLPPAPPLAGQLGAAESMLRLMDAARPQLDAGEEGNDFPTQSAVFLLRLRSLLERQLKEDRQPQSTPSRLATTAAAVGEGPAGKGSQCLNCAADAPRRRVLRHMLRIPNTVDWDRGGVGALTRRMTTAEAECQTEFLDTLSVGQPHASLQQATAAALPGGRVPALSDAHGRLALLLQHHTVHSILALGAALTEANSDPTPLKECDRLIQTRYVDGIREELKRERERLHGKSSSEIGISEPEQLYFSEIAQVLERLEAAVPTVDCTSVFFEEVGEESGGRAFAGAEDADDLVSFFGRSGAGFVSRLVAYSIQSFLAALTSATASPHRWSYLEKVLFFTDTESPVPTVPVELNATPSRGSADMDVEKTPTQERSESVRAEDVNEEPGTKSTASAWQEGEQQLQGLARKFRPCRVYDEVRCSAVPLGVKGVW
ncbi:uncharacterized protein Tco025E_03306 [Trypanosoma conorhini]|uniref:Uncharacterized protein n=1 Tax=Trypanosoma conorhini TaxID=83891 RepID=A0A422PWC1_9TRYP|nr:uncharacterized protein Tco025E_03306 [Trypanosoma conorhini]RNF22023.1 hypothetical protein Tco025E_03306 [Trypanosoma conorhini]